MARACDVERQDDRVTRQPEVRRSSRDRGGCPLAPPVLCRGPILAPLHDSEAPRGARYPCGFQTTNGGRSGENLTAASAASVASPLHAGVRWGGNGLALVVRAGATARGKAKRVTAAERSETTRQVLNAGDLFGTIGTPMYLEYGERPAGPNSCTFPVVEAPRTHAGAARCRWSQQKAVGTPVVSGHPRTSIGDSRRQREEARNVRAPRSARDAGGLTGACPGVRMQGTAAQRWATRDRGLPCGRSRERLHAPGFSQDAAPAARFGSCLPSLMGGRQTTVAGVATSNRSISGERSESAACRG